MRTAILLLSVAACGRVGFQLGSTTFTNATNDRVLAVVGL